MARPQRVGRTGAYDVSTWEMRQWLEPIGASTAPGPHRFCSLSRMRRRTQFTSARLWSTSGSLAPLGYCWLGVHARLGVGVGAKQRPEPQTTSHHAMV
jgi:hypothetical protein